MTWHYNGGLRVLSEDKGLATSEAMKEGHVVSADSLVSCKSYGTRYALNKRSLSCYVISSCDAKHDMMLRSTSKKKLFYLSLSSNYI